MKETAVDFVVEQLEKLIPSGNQIIIGITLEKAKEMEKQQIVEGYLAGDCQNQTAEQYYKETYGEK